VGLFTTTAARPAPERRALSFIAPPIGPYAQAIQDNAGGSTEAAMRQNAVFKCVRLVSDVMAQMTPIVYRGPGPGFGAAVRQPSPDILVQPSADADIFDFTYMLTTSLLLRGNGYGDITSRDKRGLPAQIELKNPDRVRVREDRDGQIVWKFGPTTMDPDRVWHKMAYRMPGGSTGLSPIKYAQQLIGLSAEAGKFGLQFFEAGGHPSGILTNPTQKLVTPQEAVTVKQRFLTAVRGREPVVMGGGWEYAQIQISPDESQFLASQKFAGSGICGIFGVPPEIVGEASEGTAITYANIESRGLDFLKFGLGGWVSRLERWFSQLVPRGQYVKLDTSQLLRCDTLTRYQALHLLVGSRIITQDEARATEDWAALTDEQKSQIDALITPIPPPIGSPKIGS
jgi:HK97 family phage portal protein